MKCPQCNYVSFDGVRRCKKCGYQFKPAGAQHGVSDLRSLITEVNVKEREPWKGDKPSDLKRTVSSIRESLDEIEGQGRAAEGEALQDQSLIVDTDEFKFRVDNGYIDTAKRFPDHDDVNWEESVSLSNHDVTIPLQDDEYDDSGQAQPVTRADDTASERDRFRKELRQIGEELREIDEVPPLTAQPSVQQRPHRADLPGAARFGGFWIRTVAYFIDNVILNLLAIMLFGIGMVALGTASPDLGELDEGRIMALMMPLYLFNTIINIFYFTYFHGCVGQTPGKMLCRLKVVRVDGESVGYGRAFLRWAGYLPSGLIFCLGFLWVAWDRHKQAWHDKIAGTCVVRLNKH